MWRLTRLHGEFCVAWNGPDGKRVRYRLGTTDAKEAHRRAEQAYSEATKPVGKTVKDLWDGYCRDKAGRSVVETMRHTWKALSERFGGLHADAITVDTCRSHTRERQGQGISDGTIHTELGHLRTVLKWAETHRLIERAPAIERPRKPEPKDRYLTRTEAKNLIKAASTPHIKLAIRLMIATGARNTAALELTWDRVDFEKNLIHLRNPFDKARRKGRATVPINRELREALSEAHRGALSPFVVEWAGKPIKSIKTALKHAASEAKLQDVSPHVFRHSAAGWMAEDGHSMEEIAQYLGHSNTAITSRCYARFSPTYLRKLADSLEIG